MELFEFFDDRLDEVDLGGELEADYLDDMDELDFNNPQMDLFPEHPSVEPGLPPGFQKVGQIGKFTVLQDKRGGTPHFDDSVFVYVLVDKNKAVAFLDLTTTMIGWLRQSISHILEGVGMQSSAIYVAPEYRNQRLAAALYNWALENVCDYIVADQTHTRQGARLWKSFLNSRKFVVEVFDGNHCLTRKRWVGKDFNRVYENDYLLPWMTIARKHNMVLFGERDELAESKKLDVPTPTVADLVKKYKVSRAAVEKQLAKGIRVEHEHTSNPSTAKEIALDHLGERLDYYEMLEKVEKETD
jgi:GNAT superfamily N-acetyltransferase